MVHRSGFNLVNALVTELSKSSAIEANDGYLGKILSH